MTRFLHLLFVVVILAAACSGSDPVVSDDPPDDPDPAGESDTDGDAEIQTGATELESVFPLPDGEVDVLFPYEVIDDEFQRRETATFLVTGLDRDTIVAFYQTTLPAMGYDVGPPIPLGDSVALNVSDPSRPALTAVVQMGPVSPSDPTIQLNQEKSEFKDDTEPGSDGETGEDGGTSSADDASAVSGAGTALDLSGQTAIVDWEALPSTPFYAPALDGDDPFFHIHTTPASDGFFLSLELYTTGYGQQWTGETGTVEISCADPVDSTGICPYFDPDGPGPLPVLGGDFNTTGSMTIDQLDDDGYRITVHGISFSDGTAIDEFVMVG